VEHAAVICAIHNPPRERPQKKIITKNEPYSSLSEELMTYARL